MSFLPWLHKVLPVISTEMLTRHSILALPVFIHTRHILLYRPFYTILRLSLHQSWEKRYAIAATRCHKVGGVRLCLVLRALAV